MIQINYRNSRVNIYAVKAMIGIGSLTITDDLRSIHTAAAGWDVGTTAKTVEMRVVATAQEAP